MKIRKIVSMLTLVAYSVCIMPAVALADDSEEKITTLRKGEPAPYSGTLFSTSAAAKLQVDLQFTRESCKLITDRELGLLRSKLQLDIDLLTVRLDTQKNLHKDVLAIKNEQIQFLESHSLEKKWHDSNEFWLVTGLVSGIIVTAVAGWAIGQAGR